MAEAVFTAEQVGDTVFLSGTLYKGTFPVKDLAEWIKWYDTMHRKHKRETYRQISAVLRKLKGGET